MYGWSKTDRLGAVVMSLAGGGIRVASVVAASLAGSRLRVAAVMAAGLIGFNLTSARAQVVDVADIESQIQSISVKLANRSCLTPAEKAALFRQLDELWFQLADAHTNAVLARQAGVSGLTGAESWRRISYDQRVIRDLEASVKEHPDCPPLIPVLNAQGTILLGFYVIKTTGTGHMTERFVTTDQITNFFDEIRDPVGAGAILGYKFTPWSNGVAMAPFVSFDWPNISVNHTFANGSFLGTKSNFAATAGVKVGPQLDAGLWLYGIAGVSLLNETLNVNFIPVSSSTTVTVPGATLGVGVAWQPDFLQGFGRPVSLFAEYQHTWWQDATFNTPAASPFFNYTFRREDDEVKLGFTISLNPPPPPAPTYPVKAPPSK
jgi:hypothetical protein